jgi:hypothetical protein
LKDYADISNINGRATVQSWDRSDRRPIVHWIPENMARQAELSIPNGMKLHSVKGMIEDFELNIGQIIQLERVGFAKIESLADDLPVKLIWLHN